MTDIIASNNATGIPTRFKDMGDGTYAQVVSSSNPITYAEPLSSISFSAISGLGANAGFVPKSVGSDGAIYGTFESAAQIKYSSNIYLGASATFTNGQNFSSLDAATQAVVWVTKITEGFFIAVTRTASSSVIWRSSAIASGWTAVKTIGRCSKSIGIPQPYYDATLGKTILIVGEYDTSNTAKQLWLSIDGGATWNSIYTTSIAAQIPHPSTNSHIHHACYDPISGRIYVSAGDGENAFFGYTNDWLTNPTPTWIGVPANGMGPDNKAVSIYNQPTVVRGLNNAIATSPDGTPGYGGIWSVTRGSGITYRGFDAVNVRPDHSYGEMPYGITHTSTDIMYQLFRPTVFDSLTVYKIKVIGTGDGGASWHELFSRDIADSTYLYNYGVVGPDTNGKLYMGHKDGGTYALDVSDVPTWMFRTTVGN